MIKVLLVDDEVLILNILKQTIPWEKYDMQIAACATNGKMALDLFNSQNFDLVITDIKMPHMTGIELIKMLHSINKEINFIIISSYDDFSLVRESFKYGALDYILKIDIDNLQAMDTILENARISLSQKLLFSNDYLSLATFYGITVDGPNLQVCTTLNDCTSLIDLKSHLLDTIKSLDFQSILSGYQSFLYQLRLKLAIPSLFFQEAYGILSYLHNTLISYGVNLPSVPQIPSYSLDILKEFNTFEKLSNYLLDLIRLILSNVNEASSYDLNILFTCYIATNYANPELSLEFISHHLNIDKKVLSKICTQTTGLHFKAYLNQVRIENAKHLLSNTSLKINEIGYAVGYSNIEHFCRVFLKSVGISPSAFQSKSFVSYNSQIL